MKVFTLLISIMLLFLGVGCGENKKKSKQEILFEWSQVQEGMTEKEVASHLGSPGSIHLDNVEVVHFYASGLNGYELQQKGLQPSSLIVYYTNGVVKVKHIMYE